MNDDSSKKRLGRGLAALIGDIDVPQAVDETSTSTVGFTEGGEKSASEKFVPIELVERNPNNPRRQFSEDDLQDLAASIREHGIVQPLVVRPHPRGDNFYELIAGERRWRAAMLAALVQVPVIVRDVDDRTALELAIIENVQRADLNPIEEATGYQQLIEEHGYIQTDLAQIIGKSRSHVANTLRLLKLPPELQQLLTQGVLSAGHARCLLTAADPVGLAQKIITEGLSVRQAEALAAQPLITEEDAVAPKNNRQKDADTRALEQRLGEVLGLRVAIKYGERGGDIRIAYKTLEQLDDLCQRLSSSHVRNPAPVDHQERKGEI